VPSRLPEPIRRAKAQIRPLYRKLTNARRGLPDFVIIGAQKAGTTSLMRYLQSHPDVVSEPGVGEVHFFDNNWQRGEHYYRAHFPLRRTIERRHQHSGHETVTGEKSPFYLFHPLVPERAHRIIPNVKLVVLLRNPVQRAASQHRMNTNMGIETLALKEAIEAEPARIEPSFREISAGGSFTSGLPAARFSYVSRGRYVEQLHRWLAFYPREQLLILRSEDLADDPETTFATTLEYLGLAPHRPEFVQHNRARRAYAIEPEVAARLEELLREPNQRLAEEFGISW
jgi:hypothetical protein